MFIDLIESIGAHTGNLVLVELEPRVALVMLLALLLLGREGRRGRLRVSLRAAMGPLYRKGARSSESTGTRGMSPPIWIRVPLVRKSCVILWRSSVAAATFWSIVFT